jgi:hypothetical protein
MIPLPPGCSAYNLKIDDIILHNYEQLIDSSIHWGLVSGCSKYSVKTKYETPITVLTCISREFLSHHTGRLNVCGET